MDMILMWFLASIVAMVIIGLAMSDNLKSKVLEYSFYLASLSVGVSLGALIHVIEVTMQG